MSKPVNLIKYMKTCVKCGTENWVEAPDYFTEPNTHDQDYFARCTHCGAEMLFWKKDTNKKMQRFIEDDEDE